MLKIFFMDQTDTSSAYYRMYLPSNELIHQGLAYSSVMGALVNNLKFDNKQTMYKYVLNYMLASDVIVAQMPKIESLPIFELLKKANKKIVIETDDLVHKLHSGFDKDKIKNFTDAWDDKQKLWSLADGFICSTSELCRQYSKLFNKPAWLFKNYIDFDNPRWDINKIDNDKIIIGWMGGNSHSDDLRLIEPVIDEVLKDYDVQFQFVTFCPEWLKKKLGLNVRYIPTSGAIDSYTPMIAQFDIGVCPLIDNEFNRCKSDLKYLEYSMLKVPTIASKANVYTDINNINGILVRNTTKEWVNAITKLIEDKPLRERLGNEAYSYVKGRDIKDNAYRYVEIGQKICR
jgi:glycosyltransferase involved in cell wall biosynthesis